MSSNGSHPPPATGQQIIASVRDLHQLVDVLAKQVEHQNQQIQQLQQVVRSEQEHTRRALLIHFGSVGLEKPTELEKERGT